MNTGKADFPENYIFVRVPRFQFSGAPEMRAGAPEGLSGKILVEKDLFRFQRVGSVLGERFFNAVRQG